MNDPTEAAYAAAIPPWCAYRTLEQHKAMLLCWSLVPYAARGESRPESSCEGCELYRQPTTSTASNP